MGNFDTTSSLAIIVFAALIHASFQASISVLTLMSGHALGKKTSHSRLLHLTGGFVAGVGAMTILLLSTGAFLLSQLLFQGTPFIIWAGICGAMLGVGLSVWLFYYRDTKGTSLWLPRSFVSYLNDRSKATKHTAEAFGLGLTSVLAELLFVFAPLVVAALVLIRMPPELQLAGTFLYAVIATLPLVVVSMLIGGGHTLASIQKWRESNRKFLQFAAGGGLFALGIYVYTERIIVAGVIAVGVQ